MKKYLVFLVIVGGLCVLLSFSPQTQIKQLKQKTYTLSLEKKVVTLEDKIESLQKEIDELKNVVKINGPHVEIRSQGNLELKSGVNMDVRSGAQMEIRSGQTNIQSGQIVIESGSMLDLLGARINLGRGGVPALTLSSVFISTPNGGAVHVQNPSSTVFIKH